MMTLNSHGIREGSKADRPDEAKVRPEERERQRRKKKILQIKERKRPRKRKKKRPLSHGE